MMDTTRADVKARKRHICEVCGWPIEPGETYERAVTFYDGTVGVWKSHLDPCCIATESARDDEYGDWIDGSLTAEDVAEWASEAAKHDPLGHPEALELNRRLNINYERARERRMKELEEQS